MVLRSTASLRRILTDVSIEGPAKQQLVRELFAEKVDAISLDLAAHGGRPAVDRHA